MPVPLVRLLSAYHVFWYRLTRGLMGHRIGFTRTLLLDHRGVRTGKLHTSPLTYGRDGENFLLVASRGGTAGHPDWYRGLVAHPNTEVQVGSRRLKVRARTASPDERPRLWRIMLREWPGYEVYQRSTTGRSRS